MNATRLIAELKDRGIELFVRDGKLRARANEALLTTEVRQTIAQHRDALLAVISGKPVPSTSPGIVWDPRGGVRTEGCDLRALVVKQASLLTRPFPRITLGSTDVDIEPGAAAWRSFARTAKWDAVIEALIVVDDPEALDEAESRAIGLLILDPRPIPHATAPLPPTFPHVASLATPTPNDRSAAPAGPHADVPDPYQGAR